MTNERQVLAETFAALLRDGSISHGAFRLWHCLYSYRNHATGACYPGQRSIARVIGCDAHSLKKWTTELENSQWIKVERTERGGRFDYVLFDWRHFPLLMWKTTTGDV